MRIHSYTHVYTCIYIYIRECLLCLFLCVSCKETHIIVYVKKRNKRWPNSQCWSLPKSLCTARTLSDFVSQNCCVSKLLWLKTVVTQNYCDSKLLCLKTVVTQNCCVSKLLWLKTIVTQNYCNSKLLCLKTVVTQNCCDSKLLWLKTVPQRLL